MEKRHHPLSPFQIQYAYFLISSSKKRDYISQYITHEGSVVSTVIRQLWTTFVCSC